MTATHTPGPWVIRPLARSEPNITHWIDGPNGVPVADVKVNGQSEGNARLIKALPDMWAALRLIAETPCDHGPGFCPRDAARAAIAAAGGKAP